MSISALTLFCEDIRNESNGMETLIGLMPDNVQFLGSPPAAFFKLGFFTRVNFTRDETPQHLTITLYGVDGQEMYFQSIESSVISEAVKAFEHSELSAIKAQIVAQGLPITGAGTIRVIVRTERHEFLSGVLNVKFLPPAET